MPSSSSSRETYKSPEHSVATKETSNKIFVTNLEPSLPLETLDNKLKEIFAKYCTIISLEVKRSFNRLYSFAFLEVKESDSVDKIVAECNGMLFEGKKMRVEKQRPPGMKRITSPDY
jgi:RNA recognition motif-containing protein